MTAVIVLLLIYFKVTYFGFSQIHISHYQAMAQWFEQQTEMIGLYTMLIDGSKQKKVQEEYFAWIKYIGINQLNGLLLEHLRTNRLWHQMLMPIYIIYFLNKNNYTTLYFLLFTITLPGLFGGFQGKGFTRFIFVIMCHPIMMYWIAYVTLRID